MSKILEKYLPKKAVIPIYEIIKETRVYLKIVNERVTRHGDYKQLPNGQHQITINANLNPYKFLITIIHELSHLVAFSKYGNYIKPHGKEWKITFQQMMMPFLQEDFFPKELLPLLLRHFRNPAATTDTDQYLTFALKKYDPPNDLHCVFQIPYGGYFQLYNGRIFKRGNQRIKRFECIEVRTGKTYLFNPNAEVKLLKTKNG